PKLRVVGSIPITRSSLQTLLEALQILAQATLRLRSEDPLKHAAEAAAGRQVAQLDPHPGCLLAFLQELDGAPGLDRCLRRAAPGDAAVLLVFLDPGDQFQARAQRSYAGAAGTLIAQSVGRPDMRGPVRHRREVPPEAIGPVGWRGAADAGLGPLPISVDFGGRAAGVYVPGII